MELVDERTPTSVLASLDYAEATIAMVLADREVQLASARRAAARYRVVGSVLGVALAKAREAEALLRLGRVAEAQSVLREALPLARSMGNHWIVGTILRYFGTASLADGDIDAARNYVGEALQYYRGGAGFLNRKSPLYK